MIENYGFYTNKIAQQNNVNSFIPTNRNLLIVMAANPLE